MNEYKTPTMKETLFCSQDVIAASGDALSGIVSDFDRSGAAEVQEASWNDNWN